MHDDTPPSEEGIAELLVRIRPRLRRVLRYYKIPYPDSDDILQEALLVAVRRWETIQNKEAWLVGTLRKKCALYWKRQRDDRLEPVDEPTLESLCAPVPPVQERNEHMWDLQTLFATLCDRHRTVLWLRYGLGLSTEEIALHTGYNDSSIRKLTCRSVARLQQDLASPGRRRRRRRAGPKPA